VPEGLKPPEGLVDARYGDLDLAPGLRLAVALDVAASPPILFVDTNLDRDLANEAPRPFAPKDGGFRATDAVALPVPGEGEPLPVEIAFRRGGTIGAEQIGLVPRIHRRGSVTLGGRVRPVALVDGNCDFRFDDPKTDRLLVDLDGDGRLDGGEGSPEVLFMGTPFPLRGKGYRASVPEAGGAIVEFREEATAPPAAPPIFARTEAPPPRDPEPPPQVPLAQAAQGLSDASRKTRIEALRIVSRYASKEAFDLLEESASKEKDAEVRAWAVHGMGNRCYLPFAKRVERFTKAEFDTECRRQAVFALHNMGAPTRGRVYAAMLGTLTDEKQKDLAEALAECAGFVATAETRKALLRAFREQRVYELRWRIYARATHADPEGRRPLVEEALRDEQSWLRGEALDDLWRLGDGSVRKHALGFLAEPKPHANTDRAAVRVLAREGDEEAVRAILAIHDRAEAEVRAAILGALAPVRDPGGLKAMRAGLRADAASTRGLCADLLAAVVEAEATDALAAALRTERDGAVVERLAQALAAHGDPRTVPALVAAARRANLEGRGEVLAALARVGAGDPALAEIFFDLLGSSRWEDRVLALDVAGRSKEARFADAAVANAGHAEWQVRLAAAVALGALRPKGAIAPLIDRLEVEESARVRAAVAEALFRIAGQPLEDIAAAWRAWWGEKGAGFAVPAEVPQRKAVTGGTVATFHGVPLRSERVCFVLDRSESMEAIDARSKGQRRTRLEASVAELLQALSRLRDEARVNVVFFGTDVEPWRKSLVPLGASNRAALAKHLQGQAPRGATNLYDALDLALLDPSVDTILLLSDGAPSAGRYIEGDEILRAVRRRNQTRRVAIHTVSVGTDSRLLRDLAAQNGGTYARR